MNPGTVSGDETHNKGSNRRKEVKFRLRKQMTDHNPVKSRTVGNSMEAGVRADDYTNIQKNSSKQQWAQMLLRLFCSFCKTGTSPQ